MQLFAIVADYDGVSNRSRSVVETFLKQRLNQELIEEYLQLYDVFLEAHHQITKKRKDSSRKRTSLNSVKVLRICTQINGELTQKQKIFVLLRIIEYVYADKEINPQEFEFIVTVSDVFNVKREEVDTALAFITCERDKVPDIKEILIVDSQSELVDRENNKHICSETIGSEQLIILSVKSVGTYVVRYFGNQEIFINGQVIDPDRTYILTQGSSIRSPKVLPIYYSDIIGRFLSDKTESKVVFTAQDITYQFKGGNMGLHPLTFEEDSGKLIGIMGASGAGKSTLLNVLNGNYAPTSGGVLINGRNIHTEKEAVEGMIGYISQDDLLLDDLTVFQNLALNAKLCFADYKDEQINKTVEDLLNVLGLYETKDLKVGNPLDKTISGGQRKRLNIALELMREPAVLFVDEPTSGLSSRDSENIMDLLKELALKGKLIFVVIHQPSSDIFKMFDKLLIMDTGGFPIYYGNPLDGIQYFKTVVNQAVTQSSECGTCGNVNPEQIFNIIETKVLDEYGNATTDRKISPKGWNKIFLDKFDLKPKLAKDRPKLPKISFKIPNKIRQLQVFVTRDLLSKISNKQYMLINLLEAPILAFVLAFFLKYWDSSGDDSMDYVLYNNENIPAYIFIAVIVALFLGLSVSAEEIIKDQKIRKRESFLNLSKGSYLMSKILIMFGISAIQTLTFVLIGNAILGIGLFFDYWLMLFTTACFANMLGLNISASFNSAVTIYILIPFLIIPQLLFSGVIVKFEKLNPTMTTQKNVPFIGEIMTSRWAFEGLVVNQFKNNDFEEQFYPFNKEMSVASFKKNFWVPVLQGKVGNIENNFTKEEKQEQIGLNLELLYSELDKELAYLQWEHPDFMEKLTLETVSKEVLNDTKKFLKKINKLYINQYNTNSNLKDELVRESTSTEETREAYRDQKNSYTNESLSDLVSNKTEVNQIAEAYGELIQRADPIYLDPDGFRAHFYAPRKKFMGLYYDTYWVNFFVIWTMSLLLMVTLYFESFRKIFDLFGKLGGLFKGGKS